MAKRAYSSAPLGRTRPTVGDLRGLLGLAAILALAFLVSNNRGRIRWRTVAVGLAFQVAFAALLAGSLVNLANAAIAGAVAA